MNSISQYLLRTYYVTYIVVRATDTVVGKREKKRSIFPY